MIISNGRFNFYVFEKFAVSRFIVSVFIYHAFTNSTLYLPVHIWCRSEFVEANHCTIAVLMSLFRSWSCWKSICQAKVICCVQIVSVQQYHFDLLQFVVHVCNDSMNRMKFWFSFEQSTKSQVTNVYYTIPPCCNRLFLSLVKGENQAYFFQNRTIYN